MAMFPPQIDTYYSEGKTMNREITYRFVGWEAQATPVETAPSIEELKGEFEKLKNLNDESRQSDPKKNDK